jgi:hypothetical protein
MIKTLGHAAAQQALTMAALFAMATLAFAQSPTDAQRSAIRSQCRADYQAHCASVPPGGAASLQCLQKNMSSLSASCQTAVRAVEPPAAPKAESAPAAETAKPAAETAATPAPTAAATTASPPAPKPDDAQIAAIRSACRSDYPKVCAGVPTGGAPALQCLEKNKSKLSSNCQQAVNAAGGGAATSAPGAAAAATASPAAAPALVLRPMRPREELMVLRSACGGDVRALCGGVAPGGGRIVQCLARQPALLTSACKEVLAQFAAR